jgi:hypothetical protein
MIKKFLAAPLLAAALLTTAGTFAATAAPASAQVFRPYGYGYNSGFRQSQIRGVVTSFYRFDMTIQLPGGRFIPVQLHQGTVIKPLGARLVPGMPVLVHGYWYGGTFFANRIRVI